MTRQELEAALEADWESVVTFFHNLFHKAAQPAVEPVAVEPSPVEPPLVVEPPAEPAAPVVPVVEPQVISDPVVVPPVAPAPSVEPAPVSAFNPHKTNLDASDIGGLFEPGFGTTNYTITGPLKVFLVIDGTEVLTEKASLSVDGSTPQDATVNGTAALVPDGAHGVVVQNGVVTGRTRLQVQAVA